MFDVRQEKSKKSHPECNRGGERGDDLAGRLRSCGVRKRRETRGPGLRRVRRRLARSRRPGRLRLNHRTRDDEWTGVAAFGHHWRQVAGSLGVELEVWGVRTVA